MPPPPQESRTDRPGFAAIAGVLIVASTALLIATANAMVVIRENRETVHRADSAQARYLALSCGDIALLKLDGNVNYTGNEAITVDGQTCQIQTIVAQDFARTITTNATVNGHTSRLRIKVDDVATLTVGSWTEIP